MDHFVTEIIEEGYDYFIGVDVGGTNSRVAIATINAKGVSTDTLIFSAFKSKTNHALIAKLQEIGHELLAKLGKPASGGCLAAAGRIINNKKTVEITNYDPDFQELNQSDLPESLFPPKNTHFLNDLESSCYGLIGLDERSKLSEYFQVFWSNNQIDEIRLIPIRYLVFAMGTGLGIALLLVTKHAQKHEVLSLEFGHILHAGLGAMNEDASEDKELLRYLSAKLYGSQFVPETEDICSGRGLEYVYEWICSKNPEAPHFASAQEIAKESLEGNFFATKAMLYHYKWLFRSAQNLCVGLQAQGVFLAGDNQVNNNEFVNKYKKQLRDVFLNHPKRAWIENISFFAQTKVINTNIEGTIYYAQNHLHHQT